MTLIATALGSIGVAAALQGTLAMAGPAAPPPPLSLPPPLVQTVPEPVTRPAPPPVPVRGPRAVAPRNPRAWAARIHENYPIEAREQRWEGVVALTVTVAPDGRASDCKVTQSSGHAILDTAACTGMLRYSRFDPALDRNGSPVASTFSTRITYRLQPPAGPAAPPPASR